MFEPRHLVLVRVQTAGGTYRVGTGYAVTAELVLTARHVVRGRDGAASARTIELRFLEQTEWLAVSVAWESAAAWDACLLRLPAPVASHEAVAFGEYDRSVPVAWETWGYPSASEVSLGETDRLRDTADVRGSLGPGDAYHRGLYGLTVDGPAAAEAWAGLSGAPVFADGRLVGLIRSAPEGFDGARLWVTPVARLFEEDAFRRAVGEPPLGWVPASILENRIAALPPIESPSAMLHARHRVVPFFEPSRRAEWESLTAWCSDNAPLSVRLFTGPGGAGKTRLFIEWCQALARQRWDAGFLPDNAGPEDVERLLDSRRERSFFVVIDYAEMHPRLGDVLTRIVYTARTKGRVRVALLARNMGDWWRALAERDDVLADVLKRHPPMELSPVPLAEDMRKQAFEAAYRAFAGRRDKSADSAPAVDLDDARFERMLYVHMAALAALEGLETEASELLARILAREQRVWQRGQPDATDWAREELTERARHGVAAITLRGGAAGRREVEQVFQRIAGPDAGFLPFLRRLYPGRTDARGAYLSGLEPDLLGEALVTRVLERHHAPADYLAGVFKDASPDIVHAGFIILGRISIEQPEQAGMWLACLLDEDLGGRAEAALDAALAIGKKSALSPLGQVLEASLRRDGTSALAASMESRLPHATVSLREVAAWVYETLLHALPDQQDDDTESKRARLLNNLGIRYSELGKREDALAATSEAVQLYRTLAQARPDAFRPYLALSLNNLGIRYSELGKREDALAATSEAVQIRRTLAQARPDAFRPDLASSLNNLGIRYSKLGKREDALAATSEAVQLYRTLAQARPDAFRPYLASSLNNLGIFYSALGKREDAIEATREAVAYYCDLSRRYPAVFMEYLERSVHNLTRYLDHLGRDHTSEPTLQEALELLESLTEENAT